MALPLPLRNRLAELILDSFDEVEARETIEALRAFCQGAPLDRDATARLGALDWMRAGVPGPRLCGAHRSHQAALCGRVRAAAAMLETAPALPDGGTLTGLLGRAACLADHGLYFEVHELLEPAWMGAEGAERTALQGLIQVAVAFHHTENGNREGAISLLTEGSAKLEEAGSALPWAPVTTRAWVSGLRATLDGLRAGRESGPVPSWPGPPAGTPPRRP